MLWEIFHVYKQFYCDKWETFGVCTQGKIESIHGYARFTDDPEPTIECNGKKYTAPHILIATGGHPSTVSEDDVPGIF